MKELLLLLILLPVLGIIVLGVVARVFGLKTIWPAVGATLVLAVGVWNVWWSSWDQPGYQPSSWSEALAWRILIPLGVYLFPLVSSGWVLSFLGGKQKEHINFVTIPVLAITASGINLLIVPLLFGFGCTAGLWDCP